jgi:hypothetical protein
LRGGNDACQCDDPTEELSREEVPGWVSTFELNKQTAREAPRNLDVVFLGDEFVQAWTGKNLKSPFLGGKQIETCFNQTFQKQRGGSLDGIALGISGDSVRCRECFTLYASILFFSKLDVLWVLFFVSGHLFLDSQCPCSSCLTAFCWLSSLVINCTHPILPSKDC